jgi:hypothetical protein
MVVREPIDRTSNYKDGMQFRSSGDRCLSTVAQSVLPGVGGNAGPREFPFGTRAEPSACRPLIVFAPFYYCVCHALFWIRRCLKGRITMAFYPAIITASLLSGVPQGPAGEELVENSLWVVSHVAVSSGPIAAVMQEPSLPGRRQPRLCPGSDPTECFGVPVMTVSPTGALSLRNNWSPIWKQCI